MSEMTKYYHMMGGFAPEEYSSNITSGENKNNNTNGSNKNPFVLPPPIVFNVSFEDILRRSGFIR